MSFASVPYENGRCCFVICAAPPLSDRISFCNGPDVAWPPVVAASGGASLTCRHVAGRVDNAGALIDSLL